MITRSFEDFVMSRSLRKLKGFREDFKGTGKFPVRVKIKKRIKQLQYENLVRLAEDGRLRFYLKPQTVNINDKKLYQNKRG